jgi:hypothetical protein
VVGEFGLYGMPDGEGPELLWWAACHPASQVKFFKLMHYLVMDEFRGVGLRSRSAARRFDDDPSRCAIRI